MIVKICGITTLVDARMALDAGTDWIGLNLVSGPRQIELPSALTILNGLSDPSHVVGLVTLQNGVLEDSIAAALWNHGVRRLQLYGQVTHLALDALRRGGFETILVQPVVDEHSIEVLDAFLTSAALAVIGAVTCQTGRGDARPDYVLFDAAAHGQPGGTGQRANWGAIAQTRTKYRDTHWPPFILAGGLNAANVAEAIRKITPAGVDVSSGVESAPGRKDPHRVQAFLTAVRGHAAE